MASAGGVKYICYVKGLSERSDYRSVEVAFDQYGEIVGIEFEFDTKDPETQVALFYAFVTFEDEKSVNDAIEGMNGQDLDGWPLTVTKHDPRADTAVAADAMLVEDKEVAVAEEATVVIGN